MYAKFHENFILKAQVCLQHPGEIMHGKFSNFCDIKPLLTARVLLGTEYGII
jgi:hypothetical protein